jgi:hypothetical protein
MISTVDNPSSFDHFNVDGQQQLIHPYAQEDDAGTFCVPLNISAANIPNVRDGSNVTIQVVFEGGDGNLYQCADLTLSANLTTPPSDVKCENATATTGGHGSTPSPSPSDGATGGTLGLSHEVSAYTALFLGFIGVVSALL